MKKIHATKTSNNCTSLPANKVNTILNQLQTIFQYLENNIATASMVTNATGVSQKNICRYKRDLEKAGLLFEVKKAPCLITSRRAWYLTTNPANCPKPIYKQITLF